MSRISFISNGKNLPPISRNGLQSPLYNTSDTERESLFHCRSRLSITGKSVQLLPLPSKTTTRQNTKHGHLVNERAIVLELYEEERKRGLSRGESGWIRWSQSAVKRLKVPSMTPYMSTKQVHGKTALIFDGHACATKES